MAQVDPILFLKQLLAQEGAEEDHLRVDPQMDFLEDREVAQHLGQLAVLHLQVVKAVQAVMALVMLQH
jgi:hypothetical protein